ncbi:MAG TPA: TonB-dependent receptor [Candidatus Polarisedimenticolia bacterium]|nr:TonB-dependent receptor [Candidatus Polarisedimenticolia bacterium]
MSLARCLTILLLAAPAALAAPAQDSRLTLRGKVVTHHEGRPVPGVAVELVELRRRTRTDAEGVYVFEKLAPGEYTIQVAARGYGDLSRKVVLPGGDADFALELHFHDQPVVVTTSAAPRDPMRVHQPAEVLDGERLEQRAGTSLGTTLQNEPGITSSTMSQASSRPVIRGLSGNRVLVLDDGTRVGDVSFLSDDHAVAIDPLSAQSIEVVRGPANLLYGSNAMGGVVNVLTENVPSMLHDRPTGVVGLGGSTNTGEALGGVEVAASAGPFSFAAGGRRSDAGAYHFDGGTAGNSQSDVNQLHGGVSWVGQAGHIGVSWKELEADYGIPVSEERELLGRGERGVTIAMEQATVKLRGQVTRPFGAFTGARLQAVRHDYRHTEFEESGEPGTVFDHETTELRADVTHRAAGPLSGTVGAWALRSDFQAVGEEALLPFAETSAHAGFFYEEVGLEKATLQFGGRFEDQRVDIGAGGMRRSFQGVSGAVGIVVHPRDVWSVAANVTRNFKAPSAEELFAFGPHIATFTFEIGDPGLDEETSVGVDLGFRWKWPKFRGEVTAWRTGFSDFIFLQPVLDPNTGAPLEQDGLAVSRYVQSGALFHGAELHADASLLEHLTLDLTADMVIARRQDDGEPLPRIPPRRAGVGLHWDTDRFGVGGEARLHDRQERVAPGEEPTAGFTLYNLFGHVQLTGGRVVHRFSLRVANLTDKRHRNHVSLVKDVLPEPGRTARLLYTLLF